MKKKQSHNRGQLVADMISEKEVVTEMNDIGLGIKMRTDKKGGRTFVLEAIPTQYLRWNGIRCY